MKNYKTRTLMILSIIAALLMLSGAAFGQGGPPGGTPPGHGGDVPGQDGPNVPGDPGFEFPGGGNVNPPPFNNGGENGSTDPGGGNGSTGPGGGNGSTGPGGGNGSTGPGGGNGNDASGGFDGFSGFGSESGLSGLEIAPEAPLTLPQTGGSTTLAAVFGLLLTTGGVLLAKLKIG